MAPGPRKDSGYHDLWQEERSDHGWLASDDIFKKIQCGPQGDHGDSLVSSSMYFTGSRGEGLDAFRNITSENNFWDQHHYLHGDAAPDCHELKGVQEDYVGGTGSEHLEFRMKPFRDC